MQPEAATPEPIQGIELSERFYREAVKPILDRHYPGLGYDAALVGTGSEVLGFDDATSTDHSWGPRLLLFLSDSDYPTLAGRIDEILRHELPHEFLDWSTNFRDLPDEPNTRLLDPINGGPVNHEVVIQTVAAFVNGRLGPEVYPDFDLLDWLLFAEQALLEVTAGRVFHSGLGELTQARERLNYYPDDIWLYRMASQWRRIGELEPFVGRAASRGDDLGSRLIAATLAQDVMRLGFLIERTYAPYPKWFGSAFRRLDCASELLPALERATQADEWQEREAQLGNAYQILAGMHNDLGISRSLATKLRPFHNRPFQVIDGERFASLIREQIQDERVRQLPDDVGAVDQFVDSVMVLTRPERRQMLRAVYGRDEPSPANMSKSNCR